MNNGFSTGEEDSRGPTDGGGGSGGASGVAGSGAVGGSGPSLAGLSGQSGAPVSEATCCLVCSGERCRRPAGNASYSKRVQSAAAQRRLRLQIDPAARHIYICDHHKAMIQSARTKQRRRKDSEDDSNEADTDVPDVDLFQLQVNTLRRYKKFFKVTTRPGLNKPQLADAIQKHFKSIPVNEKEILAYFIYTVKTNGNKLDQKNGLNSDQI